MDLIWLLPDLALDRKKRWISKTGISGIREREMTGRVNRIGRGNRRRERREEENYEPGATNRKKLT